jgi:hypothetical protein
MRLLRCTVISSAIVPELENTHSCGESQVERKEACGDYAHLLLWPKVSIGKQVDLSCYHLQ